MIGRQADIFVQIERLALREADLARAVAVDQLGIDRLHRAACGQPQNGAGQALHLMDDLIGGAFDGQFGGGMDQNFHSVFLAMASDMKLASAISRNGRAERVECHRMTRRQPARRRWQSGSDVRQASRNPGIHGQIRSGCYRNHDDF